MRVGNTNAAAGTQRELRNGRQYDTNAPASKTERAAMRQFKETQMIQTAPLTPSQKRSYAKTTGVTVAIGAVSALFYMFLPTIVRTVSDYFVEKPAPGWLW